MANRVSLPIKDLDDLRDFKEAIRMSRNGYRNSVLIEIGLATALRINDILNLKKKDVFGGFITVKTQKDGKNKRIQLNNRVRGLVEAYCDGLNDEDYLFNIKYVQAWKIIKKAADMCGFEGISTHSLRKTAAWHFYHNVGHDIRLTQELLGHASPADTIKYLNLSQDEVNLKLSAMDLD